MRAFGALRGSFGPLWESYWVLQRLMGYLGTLKGLAAPYGVLQYLMRYFGALQCLAAPYGGSCGALQGAWAHYRGLAVPYRGLAAPYVVLQRLTRSCGALRRLMAPYANSRRHKGACGGLFFPKMYHGNIFQKMRYGKKTRLLKSIPLWVTRDRTGSKKWSLKV